MFLVRNTLKTSKIDKSCRVLFCSATIGGKEQKYTHYGNELVEESEKVRKVRDMFNTVSTNYDKMNDAMSFGIHRLWKNTFIQRLNPSPGTKLLDVAGGSGDITFRYLECLLEKSKCDKSDLQDQITVCDISEDMLNLGKRRAENYGYTNNHIKWLVGDAEDLSLDSDSFDAYTISFGIRNVTHIDKVLDEAYRVLKPGGRFLCLEFSNVNNDMLKSLYDMYSFTMIPVIGQIIAGEYNAYKYLVESIRKFPDQEMFKTMIQDAGFSAVTYENMTFGVVAIHSGFKL